VIDPRTHKSYVLISSDMFERVKALLNDEDYSLQIRIARRSIRR
jgi:hypothetical protein